jgi:hypothetical protein
MPNSTLEAKNIEERNLVILNPPEDLDCSALFTGFVNSFSFDAVYRYSKAYAMIRVLGEELLLVIFLLVMFFAMLTVATFLLLRTTK